MTQIHCDLEAPQEACSGKYRPNSYWRGGYRIFANRCQTEFRQKLLGEMQCARIPMVLRCTGGQHQPCTMGCRDSEPASRDESETHVSSTGKMLRAVIAATRIANVHTFPVTRDISSNYMNRNVPFISAEYRVGLVHAHELAKVTFFACQFIKVALLDDAPTIENDHLARIDNGGLLMGDDNNCQPTGEPLQ